MRASRFIRASAAASAASRFAISPCRSAVTGDRLAKANANTLSDYIVRTPGVVFNDYQPGVSEVIIRGVSATACHEPGQTTTGYYLDEIPLVEPGFPTIRPRTVGMRVDLGF